MSNRVELNDELMENVIGGTITFDWDGKVGHCGLNGDKSYTFTSRGDLIAFCKVCHSKGMTDAECLNALIENGIIY